MSVNPVDCPYYAVIFTSRRRGDDEAYQQTALRMLELARQQDGFLHVNSVRSQDGVGITVSYWRDLAAIKNWQQQAEHLQAQQLGRDKWYSAYRVRICKVEREYAFEDLISL